MEKTLHPNLSAPSSPTAPSAATQSGEGAQGGPKTKGAKDVLERFMHLLFLLCGIVAVAFVLCISVYLIISGLPSIISVSETALRAVPEDYEQASLALGATHLETVFRVTVPAARSGVATAIVLGVGRAIGEAMAIIMVAGNVANMPGLFQSVRFLTTAIASEMSYASVGSLQRNALFSIGLVLFLFIMLINVFLNVCIKRKKEA